MESKSFNGQIDSFYYDEDLNLIKKIVGIDGIAISYSYDEYLRLASITENSGNRISSFEYEYAPNFIKSSTTYGDAFSKVSYNYFDGLNRPVQSLLKAFANGADVITEEIVYNSIGQVSKKFFLPNNHLITLNYEASPLNRISSEMYPDSSSSLLSYDSENGLFKKTFTDEVGNVSIEFKDKIDRLDHFEDALGNTTSYTYYINNQVKEITSPNGETFEYEYERNDLQTKKVIPGQEGSNTYTYNQKKLVASSTDPNGNVLSYTYDNFGRVTEEEHDSLGILVEYFYDESAAQNCPTPSHIPCDTPSKLLNGRLVAQKTRLLDDSPTPNFIWSSFHYDEFGRVEKTYTESYDGKVDELTLTYNDADNVVIEDRLFDTQNTPLNIKYDNKYDIWDRITSNTITIDSNEAHLLSQVDYCLEGLVMEKFLGGGPKSGALQSLDYDYNDRGWLRRINQNLAPFAFGQHLANCNPQQPIDDTDTADIVEEYTVNIGQLLQMRFNVELSSEDYENCTSHSCPEPTGCDAYGLDIPAQDTSIANILDSLFAHYTNEIDVECNIDGVTSLVQKRAVSLDSINLPLTVFRLRFCDGDELYIPDNYLTSIYGDYYIQQTIEINSYEQSFDVMINGVQQAVSLDEFLDYIMNMQSFNGGTQVSAENYVECNNLDCTTEYMDCDAQTVQKQSSALKLLQNPSKVIVGLQTKVDNK